MSSASCSMSCTGALVRRALGPWGSGALGRARGEACSWGARRALPGGRPSPPERDRGDAPRLNGRPARGGRVEGGRGGRRDQTETRPRPDRDRGRQAGSGRARVSVPAAPGAGRGGSSVCGGGGGAWSRPVSAVLGGRACSRPIPHVTVAVETHKPQSTEWSLPSPRKASGGRASAVCCDPKSLRAVAHAYFCRGQRQPPPRRRGRAGPWGRGSPVGPVTKIPRRGGRAAPALPELLTPHILSVVE